MFYGGLEQLLIKYCLIKNMIFQKIQNMMDIKGVLLQWFITFFHKRTSGRAITNENLTNKELAEELQKPIIKKINERKAHSSFTDNIWGAGSADMELISKFNKGIRYLLCVFDVFSKYNWVIPLKDKKVSQFPMLFKKI